MNHRPVNKAIAGLKFLVASLTLTGSVWLWSLISNKSISDLNNKQNSQENSQPVMPVIQPLEVEATHSSNPTIQPTPTLRSVNIGTVNTAVQQPVIQTIVINTGVSNDGGSSSGQSSAPAPVTNTKSS